MSVDKSNSQEIDLESTDRLPVLQGVQYDDDVEDDAEHLEFAPVAQSVKSDPARGSSVDLPSLAESVRSVEERIARQNSEFESLSRAYDKARDSEITAVSRAQSLSVDLASLRGLLESEQSRGRELDDMLAETSAAAETARERMEEALREVERSQNEARALRDTVDARDANITQVTHSLAERDAQLSALQREHAKIVPMLEERSQLGAQLEFDLKAERERSSGLAVALRDSQQSVGALSGKLREGDEALRSIRRELQTTQARSTSFFEKIRTREWRRGFDENLYRELDAQIGAAQSGQDVLQAERDRLRQRVTEFESKLATREEAIAQLQAAASGAERSAEQHQLTLKQAENVHGELTEQLRNVETERLRLSAELEARDAEIAELLTGAEDAETERSSHAEIVRQAEEARAVLARQIGELNDNHGRMQAELAARDDVIAELQSAAAADEAARALLEQRLQQGERARVELTRKIDAHEAEKGRLEAELTSRDQAVAEAQNAIKAESQRSKALAAAAEKARTDLEAQISDLKSDAKLREDKLAVLASQLLEARRPLEPLQAEIKRLTDELVATAASVEALSEDNRSVRSALERARGALEEREFLIRRLERNESNNANVLGRIQTSIQRLGTPAPGAAGTPVAGNPVAEVPVAMPECVAELLRVDGNHKTAYVLSRRTRIGRAPGCELQIESSSVSRHHALLLVSARDVIVEDLNSTNGVLVNGRRVTRHLLKDGDLLTIGEAQLRLKVKPASRSLEASAPELR